MAQYRMQVAVVDNNQLARDYMVNTFYLDSDVNILAGEDLDSLAQDTANLFASYRTYPTTILKVVCKLYDMSDPEPRPIKAQKEATPTKLGASGPREVACCLSYYAGRNLPRLRGRMYIGPWPSAQCTETPTSDVRTSLGALAAGISALGGANIQWVQYSPTTGDFTNVTNWWVDSEWDTMRSRGLRAALRTTGTVSG
jgi:hypothetical protein